ncbi:MAG: hypothetical protein QGG40_11300, partial [Myxococcota bacterium]|nr:hypothetical protein [Myxococcota bacterium]
APELGIGGYDGSHVNTPLDALLDSGNPNPPDLDAAPDGPYLKDVMGAEYNWIVGLGNDEVGYILPTYDFKVHDIAPYLDEPEGDHYEETRSLGPQTAGLVLDEAIRLMDWSR